MADTLTDWVEAYRRAWESNEPADIRALFTDDAEYRTEPYAQPWRGADDIVEEWLAAQDAPGDTTFTWSPLVVSGNLAVITAVTEYYSSATTYSNLWVIQFAPDGRATAFTEWFMKQGGD